MRPYVASLRSRADCFIPLLRSREPDEVLLRRPGWGRLPLFISSFNICATLEYPESSRCSRTALFKLDSTLSSGKSSRSALSLLNVDLWFACD